MCAQKLGDPRGTKRVADYVVVANYYRDGSRSAEWKKPISGGKRKARLRNQQRATEMLKGKRYNADAISVGEKAGFSMRAA